LDAQLRFQSDPLYGKIPLLPKIWTDLNGNEHKGLQYDLDYAPPMPKGAVRGNVHKQQFCVMCHVPRYFFIDAARVCMQCGKSFVFTASEQKHWYEALNFHFDSVATRCAPCRRARRSDKAVRQTLSAARAQVTTRPDDAGAQLALAEALVRYWQRHSDGPLDDAIAACRKTRRLVADHPGLDACESLFWEGLAQTLAERPAQARELLERFAAEAPSKGRRFAGLLKEALQQLDASR
jgi:predicted Rdx family selenoprotein